MENTSTYFNATVLPYLKDVEETRRVFGAVELPLLSLIFILCFPLICLSIHGLCRHVRSDEGAPVFVISLFISDLIQVSTQLIQSLASKYGWPHLLYKVAFVSYIAAIAVNIFCMVCISAERYAMVAKPVWYRNIRRIKIATVAAITIWMTVTVVFTIAYIYRRYIILFMLLTLLLPYPVLLFFFIRTQRALSGRTLLSRKDQRRITAILALVLCIYTFLFLPSTISLIDGYADIVQSFHVWLFLSFIANTFRGFNPVFDLLLYVFMRRDVKDLLKTFSSCFFKKQNTEMTNVRVGAQV